jgi:hypothetical protein
LNGVLDSAEHVAGWITANLMQPESESQRSFGIKDCMKAGIDNKTNQGQYAFQTVIP